MCKITKVVLITGLFLMGNGLLSMDEKGVDELILKMERASDPENVGELVKTQVNKVEVTIPAQKIKMNIKITDKYPDKTRTFSEIPGIMNSLRVYSGKTGWEYSKALGMREIKGKELGAMKLEMDMKNPETKMRDVFSEINVLDQTEKVGDFDCYKLTCVPKKEYNSQPVIMFVDNKKFLMRKMEIVIDSQMGPIKMESTFDDFKNVNKLIIPTTSIIKQLNMEMHLKILDTKNNVKVDNSEFEKPEPLK